MIWYILWGVYVTGIIALIGLIQYSEFYKHFPWQRYTTGIMCLLALWPAYAIAAIILWLFHNPVTNNESRNG